MFDITIVYSEPEQIEEYKDYLNYRIEEFDDNVTLLDENSAKTRRKARAVRNTYAARKFPFVFIINDNQDVVKAFYKECLDNPIMSMFEFLECYNESIDNKYVLEKFKQDRDHFYAVKTDEDNKMYEVLNNRNKNNGENQ